VRVESSVVDEIDQLELDLLYGDRHDTITTRADGGRVVSLPLVTAIELDLGAGETVDLELVAAGKLSGVVLGTGAGSAEASAARRASIAVTLAERGDCVAGGFYCGGDKLAGVPDTLYECNAGGVPLARGRCELGCIVQPAADDACRGGGSCVEGGFYCGGDKVDGDPQSLYRCQNGAGVDRTECADGCVVAAAGSDDYCR
jgi:hypothetical protein